MKTHAALLFLVAMGHGAMVTAQPASASAPSAASSAALVKPGLWEATSVIEDSASTSRRSVVSRVCVPRGDAATVDKILPVQRERGLPCENRDIRRDGNGWTWTVACRSADATLAGTGKIVLSGDAYLGRAELDLRRKGARPSKVKQTFSGNWVQACS